MLFCFALFCFVLFCSVLSWSALFCSALLCSVLFCSVLFCSVPFRSVLFCFVVCTISFYCCLFGRDLLSFRVCFFQLAGFNIRWLGAWPLSNMSGASNSRFTSRPEPFCTQNLSHKVQILNAEPPNQKLFRLNPANPRA